MASDNVFGSDELTPELLRSATFTEQDGRYDAAEVRTFLDRVASSLDVFLSADAPSALRAEFARNAAIAQQVLDAGQNASEQLRRQAGEDAHRILEETREATTRLREEVETEIARSREQVEAMRGQFIQDLRDLYDRIGASLYRFERAAEESHVAPIVEPARQEAQPSAQEQPTTQAQAAEPVAHDPAEPVVAPPEPPPVEPALPDPHPAVADAPPAGADADVELPEGAKPPAWQQLPPEAWGTSPGADEQSGAGEQSGPDAFAVQEDEPLAPGEPLVDLRETHEPAASPEQPAADESGGSWLDAADPAGTTESPAEPVDAAPPVLGVDATPPPAEAGGDWLVDTPADIAGEATEPDPLREHDDALAEALIAGTPFGEEDPAADGAGPPSPPPAQETGPIGAGAASASADAVAVRQLILDSLAAGQTRDAVEAYLRDQMGFLEPGALVDAALGTAGQA